MTTKEKILSILIDINYAYNDCSMYSTIKNLLDEMEEEIIIKIEQEIIDIATHEGAYGYVDIHDIHNILINNWENKQNDN